MLVVLNEVNLIADDIYAIEYSANVAVKMNKHN